MFGEPIINTGSPKELLLWDSRCVIRQTIGRDTKNNGCVVSLECTNGIRSAKFELQCFCGAIGCHDQLYYVCMYIYIYIHRYYYIYIRLVYTVNKQCTYICIYITYKISALLSIYIYTDYLHIYIYMYYNYR